MVQVLTWNDYGESDYIGPIKGDQPNSQAWTDGMDHTGTSYLQLVKIFGLTWEISLAGSDAVLCNCIQDGTVSYHRKRPDRHLVSPTFYFGHVTRSSPAPFEFSTGMLFFLSLRFLSLY